MTAPPDPLPAGPAAPDAGAGVYASARVYARGYARGTRARCRPSADEPWDRWPEQDVLQPRGGLPLPRLQLLDEDEDRHGHRRRRRSEFLRTRAL